MYVGIGASWVSVLRCFPAMLGKYIISFCLSIVEGVHYTPGTLW